MKKNFYFLLLILISTAFLKPALASDISKRLSGRILLQVESHGEAWYVNPKDGKRYYMANGSEAYNIMRTLGVGITNNDLEKIKNSKALAKKHSGKIFLQVQNLGEAFYIDVDGNAHYLKDGTAAYQIMRNLGLGIKNSDLNLLLIGSKEDKEIVKDDNSLSKEKNNTINVCSSWDYSNWSDCDKKGDMVRSVINSYPEGCRGGNPITNSSCAPTCSSFSYSEWGDCTEKNIQIRNVTYSYPEKCVNGQPVLSRTCKYIPPKCVFNYSSWSQCSYGQQSRTIVSKTPINCTGANEELLTRSCASPVIGPYANYELAYDFVEKKYVSIFAKTKDQWIENNKLGGYVFPQGENGRTHPLTSRWVNLLSKTSGEWDELDRFTGVSHAFYPWEHAKVSTKERDCAIKGNISFNTGEKIYHLPDCDYYNETIIDERYGEQWFCTEYDAIKNGFRRAQNCEVNPAGVLVDLYGDGSIKKPYPWEKEYKFILIDNRFGGRWWPMKEEDINKWYKEGCVEETGISNGVWWNKSNNCLK